MSETRTVERRGPLDSLLNLFSDVHGGEGRTALLLMLNVFLLLTSYYLLKTIREPLILAVRSSRATLRPESRRSSSDSCRFTARLPPAYRGYGSSTV